MMIRRRRLQEISMLALLAAVTAGAATAQEKLPDIDVGKPKSVRSAAKPKPTHAAVPRPPTPVVAAAPAPAPQSEVDRAQEKFNATQEAASEQFTTGKAINAVPFERPGEALETAVPGLTVTQHSGEGKANQYQLRGFQLDHGTDLALWLDGMPLNMRTHAHGQGYADANFLIPELLSYVIARKGPYYAEEGDFASAGAVHMQYIDKLEQGLVVATGGSFGYGRLLGIQSYKIAGGDLLAALELGNVEGPWVRPDEMHKINGVLRWSQGTQDNGLSLTGMAYANRWYSTDQIPQRAVTEGVIPLWGNIDPTDGGNTTRFSFSGRWSQTEGDRASRIEAYAIRSTLNLFNNFDYFLTQPVLGDQFHQFDHRTVLGVYARHGVKYDLAGFPVETDFGMQGRYDNIRLGLQDTWQRQPYDTLTNDEVAESSIAFWTDTTVRWNSWFRTTGGFRFDYYHASIGDIQDPLSAPKDAMGVPIWTGPWNSGTKSNAITSPKAAIVLGPWEKTELFLDFGEGFHSTDARGTVTTQNTVDGSQVATIPLLVKSHGAEIGARTKFIDGLDSTISFWWLNFDSENQFNGDTGTTQFGRPSRRYGVEFNNHYSPTDWLHFDGDLALTHTRFRGVDQLQALTWVGLIQPDTVGYYTYLGNAAGNYIPEGPSIVASVGLEVGESKGWFGALKYRYKGVYPLTEDGYFKAPANGTVNLRVGYRFDNGWKLQADAFNVTNSRSDQVAYGYGSLLKTDPLFAPCQSGVAPAAVCAIGQMDRHFHPVEPPAVRVTLSGPLSLGAAEPIAAKY
jgi:outer membrane receptor protein involved in Fe transport